MVIFHSRYCCNDAWTPFDCSSGAEILFFVTDTHTDTAGEDGPSQTLLLERTGAESIPTNDRSQKLWEPCSR